MERLLVIAAGGTGGHMFPAQALAETMLRRGWRVKLSTDARGARYAGGFPDAVAIEEVPSATFARGGALAKLGVPFRVLGGVAAARRKMRAERPAVVAGFGGYPSIPALGAAWTLGIPRMIHEQNGVLGTTNTFFAKRVDRVCCGTWPTKLPTGVEGIHAGNPVRSSVLAEAGAPYALPSEGPLQLLVIGGSQGARALSDTVPAALAALPAQLRTRLEVSHQARAEDHDRVQGFYREHQIRAEVQPFFHDVPRRMAAAALVISRSGASSVADISAIGRPSILIPYPYATADHQTANAHGLVGAGAAEMIPESSLDPQALSEHIGAILSDPERAAGMAAAALGQGRPQAAETLADIVETLAEGRR